MKVYQIITEPYQDFCFYNRNGYITLCSDPKYPYIGGNSLYDGESKTWKQIQNPMHGSANDITTYYDSDGKIINNLLFAPYKVVCPSWFVEKRHYEQHVIEQLPPLIESAHSSYDGLFNVFVFKKYVKSQDQNLLSIGLAAKNNIKGIRCHSRFTKYCQNFKAFW